MPKPFGYLVDLSNIQLSDPGDGRATSWIHAMSIGKFQHALYGEINFSPERVKAFADSVTSKVRGIEPDIDYDHKRRRDDAAGWVKNARTGPDGLHLFVEWTSEAAKAIKDKRYRYFSPEYLDEWTDAQGTTHNDVLSGGALTNRPFLKNLVPVNLSEYEQQFDDPLPGAEQDEGNEGMKLSDFAKLLGLSEDATEEQVKEKVRVLAEAKPQDDKGGKPDDELKKLAESNPAIRKLMDQREEDRKTLSEVQGKLRLAEVTGNVKALHDHYREKGYALPAALDEDLTKVLFEAPSTVGTKVIEVLKQLAEKGLVKLGENGHAGQQGGEGGDPIKTFTDKVKKFQDDNKNASYADAVAAVTLSEPDAYREYAHASYSHVEK